jgi:hypothetical protein
MIGFLTYLAIAVAAAGAPQDSPASSQSKIKFIDSGKPVPARVRDYGAGPSVGDVLNSYYFPGINNFSAGAFSAAEADFNYVISHANALDPNPLRGELLSTAHYYRGMIFLYHTSGGERFNLAKSNFAMAVKLNANNFPAYIELSRVLWRLGSPEEARSVLRYLLERRVDPRTAVEARNELEVIGSVIQAVDVQPPAQSGSLTLDSAVVAADAIPSRGEADGRSPVGRIAVNSAVPVDIYMSGEYLGSTPVTLEFPAGEVVLEYRYADHVTQSPRYLVKPNETLSAPVVMEITVDINARPWADVSLAGADTPLGQTPLSGVRVPIGSSLVFRNPAFPEKHHTITLDDRLVIAVVFP